VNFVAGQASNGVYFLNCCSNTNDAYYKFTGAAVGNVFNTSQGQISFDLQSRYSFAQRQAKAASPRYTFDVRDGNGSHLFYFLTQVTSGQLQFSYVVGGSGQWYFVPKGTEDTLFGSSVTLHVMLRWDTTGLGLYLNGALVKSTAYSALPANWTTASVFNLGAFEYQSFGGYNVSDDVIGNFAVTASAAAASLPMTISFTSPAAGATISGTPTIAASATSGIANVQFTLDGANLGNVLTGLGPSYSYSWNTATTANGTHTLAAIATDSGGNKVISSISVVVNNSAGPVVSAVSAVGIAPSGATVTWSTNTASDSQVSYGVNGAYTSSNSLNSNLVTSHSVNLSGLAPSTTYNYQVLSRDSQGILSSSAGFRFTTAGAVTDPQLLLQLHTDATEVSSVANGATVTPSIGPPGFAGMVVSSGGGTVNFTPAQSGDGVFFLNCCSNTNQAHYKFTGAGLGTIFNTDQGQITFYLKSRYSLAQRVTTAATQRYAFDVRDGNGTHLFGFLTQVVSGSLVFNYLAGGSGTYYYVPVGTEDKLFGNGVILQVTISWSSGGVNLYLNNVLVKSVAYTKPSPNWTAASNFDLGAYEYFTFGGYDVCDDVIDEFTVMAAPHL
jgi:hypothetical protein